MKKDDDSGHSLNKNVNRNKKQTVKLISGIARLLGFHKERNLVEVTFALSKSTSYCLINSCFDKGNICCRYCDNKNCSYKCDRAGAGECKFNG